MSGTRSAILTHLRRYPAAETQDLLKFLHQSAFGCAHFVSSREGAVERIWAEYAEGVEGDALPEPLDGDYYRVPLSLLEQGLSAETLGFLFYASAQEVPQGKEALLEKLSVAKALAGEGELPFSLEEWKKAVAAWEKEGFPAMGHSPAFREAYHPSYRVIHKRFISLLPLFTELDRRLAKGPVTLAIEGGSGSGKSTLGALLAERYGCNLFHTDDFFLRPEQRTPERYAEAGGNLDRERLEGEILKLLAKGEAFSYRKFDCSAMTLGESVAVSPCRLNILEGGYSMHPDLAGYYNLSVFLETDPALQKERILKRNGPAWAERFFKEWIPLEEQYFTAMNVAERCDFRVKMQ